MKASALASAFLVALTLGCSRQPSESPATPYLQAPSSPTPTTSPVPSSSLADDAASRPAPDASVARHSIPLRHTQPAGDTPPAADLDLMPGSPPDAAHPSGTAIVAELADDNAVHVTEWDLETSRALHDTKLEVPFWTLRLLRAPGPGVRLVASDYNGPLFFVQLTDTLQIKTKSELGTVSVSGHDAIAGDAEISAILSSGIPDRTSSPADPSGLFVMSFDAEGNRLAKRFLERDQPRGGTSTWMMFDNLAVLGGQVYVALVDARDGLHVLRLTRDLHTERDRLLPFPRDFSNTHAKLHAVDGHLVLDLPDQPDLLDLPLDLDLSRATHRPRPAPPPPFPGGGEVCGPSLRLASELLALCSCGKQTCLSWAAAPL
jgi:hypothetical protein